MVNIRITGLRGRSAFTLVELLVVIAIIGILIGMLMPAVQMVREAARRISCQNKMRQLGIATANFESSHRAYPPGVVDDDDNLRDALHSGFLYIAAELEQGNLRAQYDWNSDWKSASNMSLGAINVAVLQCPSNDSLLIQDGGFPGGVSDYAFSKGPFAYLARNRNSNLGMFDVNSKTTHAKIRDGLSNTIMFGEAASNPGLDCKST